MPATSQLDELAPLYVGGPAIALSPADPQASPKAFNAIEVLVDYSDCEPQATTLPLEVTITAPSATNFERRVHRRARPDSIVFVPKEGGPHEVRISEVGHNHWWGALVVTVAGESGSV